MKIQALYFSRLRCGSVPQFAVFNFLSSASLWLCAQLSYSFSLFLYISAPLCLKSPAKPVEKPYA